MITVHYLKVGRPVFTVWLIEELGLDYELNMFLRDPKTMRAPAALKQHHPLGKSPVIEDGGIQIAESGAIASYLIDTYGEPGVLAPLPAQVKERARYQQWLHYPEGSAFLPLLLSMLVMRAGQPSPALIENFARTETQLHLDYISNSLSSNPFILGDRLSGADIGLGYIVSMANRLRLLGGHPILQAYFDRIRQRPAFVRAAERTGDDPNK